MEDRNKALAKLLSWPGSDKAAVEPMLKLAQTTDNETLHVLLLRGFVGLADRELGKKGGIPPAQKETWRNWARTAHDLARRPEEKAAIQGILDKLPPDS